MVAALALARIGSILAAVNTRFRAHEVGDLVERSGAKALVMWPGFRGIDFLGILGEIEPTKLAGLETLVLYDDGDATDVAPDSVAHCQRIRWQGLEEAAATTPARSRAVSRSSRRCSATNAPAASALIGPRSRVAKPRLAFLSARSEGSRTASDCLHVAGAI